MAANSIHDLARGLPRRYVGANFEHNDQLIKDWQTEPVPEAPCNLEPGKVLKVSDTFLIFKAGFGVIRPLSLFQDHQFCQVHIYKNSHCCSAFR